MTKEEILKEWIEKAEEKNKVEKEAVLRANGVSYIDGKSLELTDEEYEKVKPYLKDLKSQEETPSAIAVIVYLVSAVFFFIGILNLLAATESYKAELNILYGLAGVVSGAFFLGIGKIISLLNKIYCQIK